MIKRVAKFEKVSRNEETKDFYEDVILPKRATEGSAGYDFYLPYSLTINPNESVQVRTGVRCKIDEGYVLLVVPRSSLGRKYKLSLDNTIGVIDSDYYNADNEGHIILALTNHSDKVCTLEKHDRIVQGFFVSFGITKDDDTKEKRKGGYGSTGK